MKITKNIEFLTEKGKVKADVRKSLVEHVEAKPELFGKADKVKNGVYEIPYTNPKGETVYVRFTVQVSEKSAHDLKTTPTKD